jgi:hypothetical protein
MAGFFKKIFGAKDVSPPPQWMESYLSPLKQNYSKNEDVTRRKVDIFLNSLAEGQSIAEQASDPSGSIARSKKDKRPLLVKTVDENSLRAMHQNWFEESKYTPGRKIKILDTRQIDALTGKPVPDTAKMHGYADENTVKDIISGSIERGLNPYIPLAMGLQENNLTYSGNPLHANDVYKYFANLNPADRLKTTKKDMVNKSLDYLINKMEYGKKLGKTELVDIIQAWNGYGKPVNKKLYGMDLTNTRSFWNDPVYGKRVMDLMKIVEENPDIKKMVEEMQGAFEKTNKNND